MLRYLFIFISCISFAQTYYVNHITPEASPFLTTVMVHNLGEDEESVSVTYFDAQGQQLSQAAVDLASGQLWSQLNVTEMPAGTSHLTVSASAHIRVYSEIRYADDLNFGAANIPAQGELSDEYHIYPSMIGAGHQWSGFVLTGFGGATSVVVTRFDAQGDHLEEVVINIDAHSHQVFLIHDLFEGPPHLDRYLKFKAETPFGMTLLKGNTQSRDLWFTTVIQK